MSMIFCRGCGKPIHDSAPICPHCGAPQHVQAAAVIKPEVVKAVVPPKIEKPIPEGIKGWSWGGFLLNWIWAMGNNTWIGLLALVPVIGWLVMPIVLGIKGREWAWQNKQWDSVEHFNRVQRKWTVWAVTLQGGLLLIGVLAAVAVPAYQSYQERVRLAEYEKQVETERQATEQAEAAKQAALVAQQQAFQEKLFSLLGKHPFDVINSAELKSNFATLLGSSQDDFNQRIQVASETTRQDGWLFGDGLAPHQGGSEEAALAVNLVTGNVFACIYFDGKQVRCFGVDNPANLPPPLLAWYSKHTQWIDTSITTTVRASFSVGAG
jgi:type II secretory pathway pseudopilin PulG